MCKKAEGSERDREHREQGRDDAQAVRLYVAAIDVQRERAGERDRAGRERTMAAAERDLCHL